jgi:hypothetical protein
LFCLVLGFECTIRFQLFEPFFLFWKKGKERRENKGSTKSKGLATFINLTQFVQWDLWCDAEQIFKFLNFSKKIKKNFKLGLI